MRTRPDALTALTLTPGSQSPAFWHNRMRTLALLSSGHRHVRGSPACFGDADPADALGNLRSGYANPVRARFTLRDWGDSGGSIRAASYSQGVNSPQTQGSPRIPRPGLLDCVVSYSANRVWCEARHANRTSGRSCPPCSPACFLSHKRVRSGGRRRRDMGEVPRRAQPRHRWLSTVHACWLSRNKRTSVITQDPSREISSYLSPLPSCSIAFLSPTVIPCHTMRVEERSHVMKKHRGHD